MGLLRSIFRFIFTLGGLLQGSAERATDAMLTASPDTIRSQFRKTREDAIKDYNDMKSAVSELVKIYEAKEDECERLNLKSAELERKMNGAIELYKKNKNEELREAYGRFGAEREKLVEKIDQLMEELTDQDALLDQYKGRLVVLQENIENLKQEEAETVADMVSSQKLVELNAKLQGLSTNTQAKNIEAIREARKTAKAKAKLSHELSGAEKADFDSKLLSAGQASAHLSAFDQAVQLENIFPVEPEQLEVPRKEVVVSSGDAVDNLFKS